MQVIIFEGIPTSGKTSTINACKDILTCNYEIIYEDETLMKILDNKDENIALKHLESYKSRIESLKVDLLIIDRFHYTHIFRSNSNYEVFGELEKWLIQYDTKIIVMKMSFNEIMTRINLSLTHRDKSWGDYVSKKGDIDQIKQYYFSQQSKLFEICSGSILDNYMINTDDRDWQGYAKKIQKLINA